MKTESVNLLKHIAERHARDLKRWYRLQDCGLVGLAVVIGLLIGNLYRWLIAGHSPGRAGWLTMVICCAAISIGVYTVRGIRRQIRARLVIIVSAQAALHAQDGSSQQQHYFEQLEAAYADLLTQVDSKIKVNEQD